MTKKKIIITLTNPRPCKFDGKDLEVRVELMPASIKALSDLVRDLLGQLMGDSEVSLIEEPRVRFTLNSDHYYGYVLIEVEELAEFCESGLLSFFSYLFEKDQAGIFDRPSDSVPISRETESIVRDKVEKARAMLGGTTVAEEVSVFVGDKSICRVSGKIPRPSLKMPTINPAPKSRRGNISGFCTSDRVVHFVENESKAPTGLYYDPAHFHQTVLHVCREIMNRVEIVTEERIAGNRRVVESIVSITELDKESSSLF